LMLEFKPLELWNDKCLFCFQIFTLWYFVRAVLVN
jgi:hypothetical protein